MVPFQPSNYFEEASFALTVSAEDEDNPNAIEAESKAGQKSQTICHSQHERVSPHKVASQQKHLTAQQQKELEQLLAKCNKLFSGKLGVCPPLESKVRTQRRSKALHLLAFSGAKKT